MVKTAEYLIKKLSDKQLKGVLNNKQSLKFWKGYVKDLKKEAKLRKI